MKRRSFLGTILGAFGAGVVAKANPSQQLNIKKETPVDISKDIIQQQDCAGSGIIPHINYNSRSIIPSG